MAATVDVPEGLDVVLRAMEDYIVYTARHRRGCQRGRCARSVCDTCRCSCGLDRAMDAALRRGEFA